MRPLSNHSMIPSKLSYKPELCTSSLPFSSKSSTSTNMAEEGSNGSPLLPRTCTVVEHGSPLLSRTCTVVEHGPPLLPKTHTVVEHGSPHRRITYTVVEHGSQRGGQKLVDSTGYSYAIKRRLGKTTYWSCSVRNASLVCPATVIQKCEVFTAGRHAHVHPPQPGLLTVTRIKAKAKKRAQEDHLLSTSTIVRDVISEHARDPTSVSRLPDTHSLARTINRHWRKIGHITDDEDGPVTKKQRTSHSERDAGSRRPLAAINENSVKLQDNHLAFWKPLADSRTPPGDQTSSDSVTSSDSATSLTYTVVKEGSQRGGDKLVDSSGYAYTVKSRLGKTAYWSCSVRNKSQVCPATVIQKCEIFTAGRHAHLHPPQPGLLTDIKIRTKAKTEGQENLSQPATVVVKQIVSEHRNPNEPLCAIPNLEYLARSINRRRQKLRKHRT